MVGLWLPSRLVVLFVWLVVGFGLLFASCCCGMPFVFLVCGCLVGLLCMCRLVVWFCVSVGAICVL